MKNSNDQGYTIIEAVVVLAIISFGLISVLALFNKSMMRYDESQKITEATIIASNYMQFELAKLVPNETISVPEESMVSGKYAISMETIPTSLETINQLIVNVSWGDKSNQSVSVSAFLPTL